MQRYSWTQNLFGGETLEASLARLARYGYAGVELPLSAMSPGEIRGALRRHQLECFSINGSFIGAGRDLSSADDGSRGSAVDYVRTCIRFAQAVGAKTVIAVPTRIGKLKPDLGIDADWKNVVDSLRAVAETAATCGVTVVLECVNRAESHLANRLDVARRLVLDVGSENVMMMADSFHMNIEEHDPIDALLRAGPLLRHVHLADNNRMAPGMGHLDLAPYLGALVELGYPGPITMECDIQVYDQYGRATVSTDASAFDRYAETAISTLRQIEARGTMAPDHQSIQLKRA